MHFKIYQRVISKDGIRSWEHWPMRHFLPRSWDDGDLLAYTSFIFGIKAPRLKCVTSFDTKVTMLKGDNLALLKFVLRKESKD